MLNKITNVYLRRLALVFIGLPVIGLMLAYAYIVSYMVAAYEAIKATVWDVRHELYHANIAVGEVLAYARHVIPETWAK